MKGTSIPGIVGYSEHLLFDLSPKEKRGIASIVNAMRPADLEPAFICEMRASNNLRFLVILEARKYYEVPSCAETRVSILRDGFVVQSVKYSSGWRLFINDIKLVRMPKAAYDLLKCEMINPLDDSSTLVAYYGIVAEGTEDRFSAHWALVRVENGHGQPLQNRYGATQEHLLIGPDNRSDIWCDGGAAFSGADELSILENLVLLSGSWGDKEEADIQKQRNKTIDMESWKVLRKSPNAWVREGVDMIERLATSIHSIEDNEGVGETADVEGVLF
jgi:hypothetical protein